VSLQQIKQRFRRDEASVVSGALNDLVGSGFVYRAGRGEGAVFRIAEAQDFERSSVETRRDASEYLVWLQVYRQGPVTRAALLEQTHLEDTALDQALRTLGNDGRIESLRRDDGSTVYTSARFDVPVGSSMGWEAAVLDHFQALVSAVCVKLRSGRAQAGRSDDTGGATYTLEIWPGHPHEAEARGLLAETRRRVDALRDKIDAHNARGPRPEQMDALVFYAGQYVKAEEETNDDNE
jgi:hypothetical protein